MLSKITHITYTRIEDFVNQLKLHRNRLYEGVVNDIMLENDYIFSFVDDCKSLYYRLTLKTFEEHDKALREIVKCGFVVVVL